MGSRPRPKYVAAARLQQSATKPFAKSTLVALVSTETSDPSYLLFCPDETGTRNQLALLRCPWKTAPLRRLDCKSLIRQCKRPWQSHGRLEWSGRESNPRPLHCERSALPIELPPRTLATVKQIRCHARCEPYFSGHPKTCLGNEYLGGVRESPTPRVAETAMEAGLFRPRSAAGCTLA